MLWKLILWLGIGLYILIKNKMFIPTSTPSIQTSGSHRGAHAQGGQLDF